MDSASRSLDPSARAVVLIVDDAPTVRIQLRQMLSGDYNCVCVEGGQQALEEALRRPPDIIVSDVVMEPFDGYELLKQVRAEPRLSDIPLILLTSQSDPDGRAASLEVGADDYLAKPVRARELLARVKSLLRLRAARTEILGQKEALAAAHDQLLGAQKRLLEAEKLSTLGNLASGVAHEINNPLSFIQSGFESLVAIVGDLTQALTEEGRGDRAAEAVRDTQEIRCEVREGLQRIRGIVQKLALLAHGEEAPTWLDARNEVDQALVIALPQVGKAVIAPDLKSCRMRVRPGYLTQIALSLVTNALDAVQHAPSPRVLVRLRGTEGEGISLEVEDNGKVGSSRVDLQACKLEYSIVSPK